MTRLAIVAVAFWVAADTISAQEVVDQRNDPVSNRSFSCGTPPILNATILQSFVPALDNLTGIELRLRTGTAFPAAGFTTTARIRSGTPDGKVVAVSTADIAGPQASGTQVLVRFDFEAVELTPGATYLIEWVTPDGTILTWVGSSGDPYADGTAFTCIGSVWPNQTDFNFATFAAAAPTPKARLKALHSEVKHRCLKRLLRAACRCLDKGRTRLAKAKIAVFKYKVKVFMCFGLVPRSVGLGWIREARDIARSI